LRIKLYKPLNLRSEIKTWVLKRVASFSLSKDRNFKLSGNLQLLVCCSAHRKEQSLERRQCIVFGIGMPWKR